MPYTLDQVQKLEAAIALGALSVRYATGDTITYRSIEDMERILAKMKAELGLRPRRNNVAYAAWRRGC